MAVGKYALGICDRTGFKYKLKDLVYEVENGRRNGLRVGRDVVDPDHPQNFAGKVRPKDTQSVKNARPEPDEASSTISGFLDRYPHTAGTRS
jgi:hypothetical protein